MQITRLADAKPYTAPKHFDMRALRLQGLVERHLALKPINANQYDQLKNLPERPPSFARPGDPDPIGAMIEAIDSAAATGSVPAPEQPQ